MEQVKRKFCGLHSLGGRLDGAGGPRYVVARLRCKSWTCPHCAKKRARRLKKAILEQAQLHGLDRFLTLTMDPSKGTWEESWPKIKAVWAKFRIYLKREYGEGVKFLWVLEAQANGYAHLHILVNRYIRQSWIRRNWEALGGGRIVFIVKAEVQRTGPYLSKYLAKGFDGGLKPGQRRYGSSRDVNLKGSMVKQGDWAMVKAPIELLFERVREHVVGANMGHEGGLEGFESTVAPIFIPMKGSTVNPSPIPQ